MPVNARPLRIPVPQQEPKRTGQVRVADNPKRRQRALRFKRAKQVLIAGVLLVLVCSVLYTQARVIQVQNQIEQQAGALSEQRSLGDMLMYQMESSVSLQDIEQEALKLGLIPMQQNQIVYMRAEEENSVQAQESGLLSWLRQVWAACVGFFDSIGQ